MHGTFHANSTIGRATRVNLGKVRLYESVESNPASFLFSAMSGLPKS
jgi:hypothetical protein